MVFVQASDGVGKNFICQVLNNIRNFLLQWGVERIVLEYCLDLLFALMMGKLH